MRLTIQQLVALVDLSEGRTLSPHQAGLEARTFRSLRKMGLVEHHGGSGQNSVWTITPAGREALSKGGNADG